MTGAHVLVELVIVLGAAALITLLFQAARLPVVLGYVAAGLVIGPNVPTPLVANVELIHVLSELGVILLMFALGLELRLSTLARVGIGAGLTALFEVALVVTIGALVAGALGFTGTESIFAGACLGISSTMLVARAFEERRWKGGFTELVFAILVFEDVIAIALLAILTGLASGSGLAPYDLAVTLGKLVGFLALLLVGGLLVIPRLIRVVAQQARTETLLIIALGLCFGLAILTEHQGYPVALGAFVAGLLVAESGLGHEVTELVRPFRDVFAMMFFVSIGMTIEPHELATHVPEILIFTAVVLIAKPIGISLGAFAAGRGIQPAIRSGVSMAQTGELSFVIAGIAIARGAGRPSLLAIMVGVTCLTTLTSSLTIGKSESVARAITSRLPGRLATFVSFYEAWLERLHGRELVTWTRVRRPVYVLVADVIAVVAIIIGGSLAGARVTDALGLGGWMARVGITVLGLAAISPFAVGIMRRIALIAHTIASVVIPEALSAPPEPEAGDMSPEARTAVSAISIGGIDLGRAPRRALTLTLELALAAAVGVPLVAAVQPFIGTSGLVAGAALLVLLAITYRSIVDFTKHVRAGSELILELMHQPASATAPQPLSQIESVLPGFGGLVSITLAAASPAVGQSLATLDLRARTGATVLAIARGEGGFATPTPTEPLREGDIIALTGSDEALAAARELLAPA